MFEVNWTVIFSILGCYAIAWLMAIAIIWKKNLWRDWSWGILPVKDSKQKWRDHQTRLSSEFRITMLYLLATIGSTVLWTADMEFFHPWITGLNVLVFSCFSIKWGWELFNPKRNTEYRHKSRWSGIPLPQWDLEDWTWNIRAHYFSILTSITAMLTFNALFWVWFNYVMNWFITIEVTWQTVAIGSWIVIPILSLIYWLHLWNKNGHVQCNLVSATTRLESAGARVSKLTSELKQARATLEEEAIALQTERYKTSKLTHDITQLTDGLERLKLIRKELDYKVKELGHQTQASREAGRMVVNIIEDMRRTRQSDKSGKAIPVPGEQVGSWRFKLLGDVLPRLLIDDDKRDALLLRVRPREEQ